MKYSIKMFADALRKTKLLQVKGILGDGHETANAHLAIKRELNISYLNATMCRMGHKDLYDNIEFWNEEGLSFDQIAKRLEEIPNVGRQIEVQLP